MNRGSQVVDRLARGDGSGASMRPRFMNRGSAREHHCRPAREGRFNEAPIHESGKSRATARQATRNGASMRPRFMNRGSSLSWGGSSGTSPLQ